ncbi:hypothetical protein APA_347 [Pseudanabaena sp. lw0831]|nr:hypothetical protein APA_347 [Pseudanabaena sp. lw0831]
MLKFLSNLHCDNYKEFLNCINVSTKSSDRTTRSAIALLSEVKNDIIY